MYIFTRHNHEPGRETMCECELRTFVRPYNRSLGSVVRFCMAAMVTKYIRTFVHAYQLSEKLARRSQRSCRLSMLLYDVQMYELSTGPILAIGLRSLNVHFYMSTLARAARATRCTNVLYATTSQICTDVRVYV